MLIRNSSLALIFYTLFTVSESCTPPKPSPVSPSGPESPFEQLARTLRTVLGGNIYVESRIKNIRGDLIRHPKDLYCQDFSPWCRWRNPGGGAVIWLRGRGAPEGFRLRTATGTSRFPSEPFAIAASSVALPDNLAALLASDPIPCQQSDGELRLKYWTSPLVQLVVCIRRIGRTRFDYCSPPIATGDPGPAFITLPGPLLDPFEIFIRAEKFSYRNGPFQGGFAMIDDIEYVAELCGPRRGEIRVDDVATTKAFKQVSTHSPFFINNDKAACKLLKCNFDRGPCVDYIRGSGWRIRSGPVGNPLTGIRGDASFLPFNPNGTYAFVEGPGNKIRFETPAFHLPMTRNIEFFYYKASAETKFEVHAKRHGQPLKSLFRAPFVNRDSRRWFRELRQLLSGTYEKLIFEADNMKINTFIGLDEIRLVGKQRQSLC